jgi:hypothetical protein
MPTVAHLVDPSDVTTLTTTFLDSAAALETRLHDTERQTQSLQRELRRAHQRQDRARQWIVALRRSHRTASHAKTAALFTLALADVTAKSATPVAVAASLFPDARAGRSI